MSTQRASPTVLIGFAEALSAPEAAWSLLDEGFTVVAFTRRGTRPPLRYVQGVRVAEIAPPEHDLSAASGELRALVEEVEPAVLLPLDDAAVWLAQGSGARVAGPTGEQTSLALDKRLQFAAAEAAGFAVPPTTVVAGPTDAEAIGEFPVFVRPATAISIIDGRLLRRSSFAAVDRDELVRGLDARAGVGGYLVQPVISGNGEGLFGIAAAGRGHAWSAHRRLRMMNPRGSGSSACESICVDPAVIGAAEDFVQSTSWQGMFMFELLRERSGTLWFVEFNGRAWGSMALARRSGLEYPAWTVREMIDSSFSPVLPSVEEHIVCRHLGREIVHLAYVARGPVSRAETGWPSLRRTLRDVLTISRRHYWYNSRPGARRVFLYDTVRTVVRELLMRQG